MGTAADLWLEGAALVDGALIDPAVVLVAGGRVQWCGPAAEAPAAAAAERRAHDGVVAPGFIDLHVHGAGGVDAADGSLEALRTLCQVHAAHGTVGLCPTVLSSAPEATLRAVEAIRDAAAADDAWLPAARVLGSHLEGPFLNPARAGAQPAEHLRAPDRVLMEELLAAAAGSLRIVTLAPELPGALDLVALLVERGVVVGLGHTDATWAEARAAIAAGARLAAHTFNAMRPLHHREPGVLGAVLEDPEVTAEVIADGVHVSGPILRLLRRLKGPERVCLATDCTAALAAPPHAARLGGTPVQVVDGAVRLADGTLAGSSLTMDRAVANLVDLGGAGLAEALGAASRVPARVLGRDGGALRPGAPADLVLLDRALRVTEVLVAGKPVARPEDHGR